MSTSILYQGLHTHESYFVEIFGVNGYILIDTEDVDILSTSNLAVIATRNLRKSLACKIEVYLFLIKFNSFTRFNKHMFQLLILKGIGNVCHLFIVIEFVHNHRNNLQCLVANIAQGDLEQLFRLCEICPCIVRHRIHLEANCHIKVGKHYILACPEVQSLCCHMYSFFQILGISRDRTQTICIHKGKLQMIFICKRYYLIEITESILLLACFMVYTYCSRITAKLIECLTVKYLLLLCLEHELGLCVPLRRYI